MEKLNVVMCVYHRNGISGIGFYAMNFSYIEDGIKHYAMATVSSEDFEKYCNKQTDYNPETRVILYSPTGGLCLQNTMRGDWFHNDLCEWLKRNPQKRVNYTAK